MDKSSMLENCWCSYSSVRKNYFVWFCGLHLKNVSGERVVFIMTRVNMNIKMTYFCQVSDSFSVESNVISFPCPALDDLFLDIRVKLWHTSFYFSVYHALYLDTFTSQELIGKLAKLYSVSSQQIAELYCSGPSGIYILITNEVWIASIKQTATI